MSRALNPLPQLIPQRVGKAKQRVDAVVWSGWKDLTVSGGPVNAAPIGLKEAQRQRFTAVKPGSYFGPKLGDWQQRWLKTAVPAAAAGERGRRYLHWECQGEATVYLDGEPYAGLDCAHRTVLLPDRAVTLWIDLGTYSTGMWAPGFEAITKHGVRFDSAKVAVRDAVAWKVSWDLEAFVQLMNAQLKDANFQGANGFGYQPALERCSPLVRRLLRRLDDACDVYNAKGLAAFSKALDGVFASLPAESWQPGAAIAAQTHIDLVWLWPEIETERKGVHSFATMQRLMDAYPEFLFTCSQPALYRAIERRAPGQAKRIKALIRSGRWEAMGGFEVEPDNQLPSGEALARSLVVGQRKLAELRGGTISSLCWLPDVFGYAACLPQILRLGGVEHFYTTKMTWSTVTKFPYNSFVWRGSDGSEVLAQLCTVGYTGVCDAENLITALRDFRQADVHDELLVAQGIGDGGGGPTEGMLERTRRFRDLAGMPKAKFSKGEDFFRRMEKVRDRLPVYQGELYLEYHRGTYTTQSEFKRLYRAAESALQVHEAVRVVSGGKPIAETAWQRVAFCQFHDAIPGSSIGLVYQQLNPELAALADTALAAAGTELAGTGRHSGLLAFNPLPQRRSALVSVPAERIAALRTPDGRSLPMQRVGSGKSAAILALVEFAALGSERLIGVNRNDDFAALSAKATRNDGGRHILREVSANVLDNGLVRAEFDRRGQLASLTVDGKRLDLAGRPGLAIYHDQPSNFDAWDIDHYTLKHGTRLGEELKLTVVERGPVRAILRGQLRISATSTATIDYVLDADCRWLRIEVAVDWNEDRKLLKYHVPTGYRGRWARFGTPFGSIQRPQAPGVQADEAMWEVPGSRWAAVTDENGAGLALITEAKFGFSCRDGDLGLSLLRAPKDPDKEADLGQHRMRFAIGRHHAHTSATAVSTAAAADALFAPILTVAGGQLAPPPLELENLGSLVPSWVLPAEGGGWTLRLHETNGERGSAVLHLASAAASVEFVDFLGRSLEKELGKAKKIGKHSYQVAYRPYQIVSVRVR